MPQKSRLKLKPINIGKETIGQRIARVRKEKGLTQAELAERMGLIQPLVSDYERDRLRLPTDMLIRIAQSLEVSLDYLLGLKNGTQNNKDIGPSLRLLKRVNKIESLPKSEQKTIIKMIDTFLKASKTD